MTVARANEKEQFVYYLTFLDEKSGKKFRFPNIDERTITCQSTGIDINTFVLIFFLRSDLQVIVRFVQIQFNLGDTACKIKAEVLTNNVDGIVIAY